MSNSIEKEIQLKAPKSRVWQALADSRKFGEWFGCRLEGKFEPGARVRGRVTNPGYEHLTMDILIERVEPERLFSYRWHPAAIEEGVDYDKEKMTLVEFTLEERDGGTLLKVVESGFDEIPAARREKAFRLNDGGWTAQVQNIAKYVDQAT